MIPVRENLKKETSLSFCEDCKTCKRYDVAHNISWCFFNNIFKNTLFMKICPGKESNITIPN